MLRLYRDWVQTMRPQDLLTLAHTAVTSADPHDTTVAKLLSSLTHVVEVHGLATAETMIRLLPIAQAKGDSRQQLEEVLDRHERGLPSTAFIQLDPNNRRYPTSIVETGRLSLANLSLVSPVRT